MLLMHSLRSLSLHCTMNDFAIQLLSYRCPLLLIGFTKSQSLLSLITSCGCVNQKHMGMFLIRSLRSLSLHCTTNELAIQLSSYRCPLLLACCTNPFLYNHRSLCAVFRWVNQKHNRYSTHTFSCQSPFALDIE